MINCLAVFTAAFESSLTTSNKYAYNSCEPIPQRWLIKHFAGSLSAVCTCSEELRMPVGSNVPASSTVGSGEQRGITGYIIVASYYNFCSEYCLPTDISFRCFFINPVTSYVFQSPCLIFLFCSHKAATPTGLFMSYKLRKV